MQVKKLYKCDAKLKEVVIESGEMIDTETGEKVDLLNMLEQVYGSTPFSISATSKNEDCSDISALPEEIDIDDLAPVDVEVDG